VHKGQASKIILDEAGISPFLRHSSLNIMTKAEKKFNKAVEWMKNEKYFRQKLKTDNEGMFRYRTASCTDIAGRFCYACLTIPLPKVKELLSYSPRISFSFSRDKQCK